MKIGKKLRVVQEIFNMKNKICFILLNLFSLFIFAQKSIDYSKLDPIKYVSIKEEHSGFLYPDSIKDKNYKDCYIYSFNENASNGVKTVKFYADYWFIGDKKLKQSCFEINNKKFFWKSNSLNNISIDFINFIIFEINRKKFFLIKAETHFSTYHLFLFDVTDLSNIQFYSLYDYKYDEDFGFNINEVLNRILK